LQFSIQAQVFVRRVFPTKVLVHCRHHHLVPTSFVAMYVDGVLNNVRQRSEVLVEREAGMMIDGVG
jgi:hypothetical protein